jgi:hypothetical protein
VEDEKIEDSIFVMRIEAEMMRRLERMNRGEKSTII